MATQQALPLREERRCMYGTDPKAGHLLRDRICPHPEAFDTEVLRSPRGVQICGNCLIDHAAETQEPSLRGVWGPIRELGEFLCR